MRYIANRSSMMKTTAILAKFPTSGKGIGGNTELILMEKVNGQLLMSVTDGRTMLSASVEVEFKDDGKGFCTWTRLLAQALSNIEVQEITLSADDKSLIISWDGGHMSLPAYDIKDFPSIKKSEKMNVGMDMGRGFSAALKQTVFAMGEDDLRPVLKSVNVKMSGNRLAMAASDSHVIAVMKTDADVSMPDFAFNIPSSSVSVLRSILGEDSKLSLMFSQNEGDAEARIDDCFVYFFHIDLCKYPDYETVLGSASGHHLRIDRNLFSNAVKAVSVCGGVRKIIGMDISSDKVCITANDMSMNLAATQTIQAQWDGEPMNIHFDGFHLMKLLAALSSEHEVMMEITASNRCVLITGGDDADKQFRIGIMPSRAR